MEGISNISEELLALVEKKEKGLEKIPRQKVALQVVSSLVYWKVYMSPKDHRASGSFSPRIVKMLCSIICAVTTLVKFRLTHL